MRHNKMLPFDGATLWLPSQVVLQTCENLRVSHWKHLEIFV